MSGGAKTLAIAFFQRKFGGEAAQFELGLHRIAAMSGGSWGIEWVELDPADTPGNVRLLETLRPDLVLLHANRTQMVETVAFIGAMGDTLPELPLLLCGWVAQPAYIDAAFVPASGLAHPRFALACGEVEAIVPPLLDRLADQTIGARSLEGHPGVVTWDASARAWNGSDEFLFVDDMNALPDATIDHIAKSWRDNRAGWVELSRGCKLRCSFCFACCYKNARMRSFSPERVREAIRVSAEKGVKVLGLYTASVSLDIDLFAVAIDAFREYQIKDVAVVGAVGPVDKRFIAGEKLERLSKLDWSVMTIGLQTITPEAIKQARRADDIETFAKAMEYIATFTTPEVELILGLPGDTPEGFKRTIEFVLTLPVNVTVQTFRLDPWSTYFDDRDQHGLVADFRNVARVHASNSFTEGQIAESAEWLRGVGKRPWTHRARQLAFDGDQIGGAGARRDERGGPGPNGGLITLGTPGRTPGRDIHASAPRGSERTPGR